MRADSQSMTVIESSPKTWVKDRIMRCISAFMAIIIGLIIVSCGNHRELTATSALPGSPSTAPVSLPSSPSAPSEPSVERDETIRRTTPQGDKITILHHDERGLVTFTIDETGHRTLYSHDRLGRIEGVRLSDGTDFRIAYAAETAVITAIQRNAQPLSAHDLIWQDRSLMRKDAATGVWLVVIPDPTKGEVDIQGPVL